MAQADVLSGQFLDFCGSIEQPPTSKTIQLVLAPLRGLPLSFCDLNVLIVLPEFSFLRSFILIYFGGEFWAVVYLFCEISARLIEERSSAAKTGLHSHGRQSKTHLEG